MEQGKLQMQIVFYKICDSVHDKTSGIATQGLLDLDGRNSQKYLHQT